MRDILIRRFSKDVAYLIFLCTSSRACNELMNPKNKLDALSLAQYTRNWYRSRNHACTIFLCAKRSITTADIAKSLPSNQWYALAYNGWPIGHVHHTFRWHPESGFSFTEELQFKLGTDQISEIVKRFHFSPDDPYHLIHASREYLGNANSRIDVTRVDDQLIANADNDITSMVGAYKLEDFIKLKRWHASKKLRIHESNFHSRAKSQRNSNFIYGLGR